MKAMTDDEISKSCEWIINKPDMPHVYTMEHSVKRVIATLQQRNDHNGVVVAGCNPWYISVMPKPPAGPKEYAFHEFKHGRFYQIASEKENSDTYIRYGYRIITLSDGSDMQYLPSGKIFVEVIPTGWETVKQ